MLYKYNVIDLDTKQVFPGLSAIEVSEKFNISKRYVTSCAKKSVIARGKYKIEGIEINREVDLTNKVNHLPHNLLVEWDRVCKPINKALKNSGKSIKLICPDLGA